MTGTISVRHRTTVHFWARQSRLLGSGHLTYLVIVEALHPGDQTQQGQDLRLYLECDVKLFDNVVHSQRYSSPSPEHHHGWLQACSVMSAVVDYDLW